MSVVWSSPRSSQPWSSHPAARLASAIRRALVADRAVMRLPSRRRPVTLSEWRGVLDALAQLHKFAAESAHREDAPLPRWRLLSSAALTFGTVRSATDEAPRTVPSHRNERTGGR